MPMYTSAVMAGRCGNSAAKRRLAGKPYARPWSPEMDIIRIILSILLPPVGVFLQVGLGLQFWINIVLTLLGYIPGVVHAIWIIARH